MYPIILLDFDGTLCSSSKATEICIQHTFKHFKLPLPTDSQAKELISQGLVINDIISKLIELNTQTKPVYFEDIVSFYKKEYPYFAKKNIMLFKDMLDTLKTLHTHSRLAILTNNSLESITILLKHLNIDKYFTFVFASTKEFPKPKPDSNIFNKLIKPSFPHSENKDFILVGDTNADISFAMNNNIDSAFVDFGYGKKDEVSRYNPTFIFSEPKELCKLIVKKENL